MSSRLSSSETSTPVWRLYFDPVNLLRLGPLQKRCGWGGEKTTTVCWGGEGGGRAAKRD